VSVQVHPIQFKTDYAILLNQATSVFLLKTFHKKVQRLLHTQNIFMFFLLDPKVLKRFAYMLYFFQCGAPGTSETW
jgi:hypothetical protein